MAQELGKLDGERSSEVGIAGLGTVADEHGLRDEAGTLRHLQAEGCRRGQEAVSRMVGLGARDARANRRTVRANGLSCPDDR